MDTEVKTVAPLSLYEDDLLEDYRGFRQKYSFLGGAIPSAGNGQRVLVVNMSHSVVEVKLQAMLAKALQIRGMEPAVVTLKTCEDVLKYFRVFGYDAFYPFDEMVDNTSVNSDVSILRKIEEKQITFGEICGFQYRGVSVGRHVLSSLLRVFRLNNAKITHPEMFGWLREKTERAMRGVLAAERLMDMIAPNIVLFLESGYLLYGEIFDVAINRGLNTIQYKHSHRPDALVLKRYHKGNRNVHPFSLSEESWKAVRDMPWTQENEKDLADEIEGNYCSGRWFNQKFSQTGKAVKPVDVVKKDLGVDPDKKNAIIFSHVLWDATFFYGENLFEDYEQWLVETVKAACENRAVNWIVKIHPDYVWKMKQAGDRGKPGDLLALESEIGPLPNHIKVVAPDIDINTFSFLKLADYCITVRGTVGIEASCLGVPVLTAGTGRYSNMGFTIDSKSRQEYLERIRNIQDISEPDNATQLLAKRHAYGLLKLRPLTFHTYETVQMPFQDLGHPLDNNVVIHANCLNDLFESEDLAAFGEWAMMSRKDDFLHPGQTVLKNSR